MELKAQLLAFRWIEGLEQILHYEVYAYLNCQDKQYQEKTHNPLRGDQYK